MFDLIDKDHNKEISIKEFVLAYILLEEKMKIKNIRIQKEIEELEELMKKNDKGILENKDESLNENGVAKNAGLYVSLMEAKNLKEDFLDKCDSFVILTLDKEVYQSNFIQGQVDPVWNEDFTLLLPKTVTLMTSFPF